MPGPMVDPIGAARPAFQAVEMARNGATLPARPHCLEDHQAVISYTQSAALAMAPHGIRVNGIAPGVVHTPM